MFEKISHKKILVTGGSGFLGRHTVSALLSKGVSPTILARNLPLTIAGTPKEKLNCVEINLLDAPRLENFLENLRPDIIIHLAGITHSLPNQPESLEQNNYQATVNLLDAARKVNAEKIIVTGTADEYGFQKCPQTETMSAMPVSDYAVSKNRAVKYALSLYQEYAAPIIILRPFTIYGTGQPVNMFVSQAVECAVSGSAFEMSKGEQKRDLLFVTDFAKAVLVSLETKHVEGEIFNVGGGQAIALRDLAEKIWKIAGADERLLKIGARHTSPKELHDTKADISKIKELFNWQPEVSLEEGLALMIEERKKELQ